MKISDLVENLEMSVDFYMKAIYNWDKHVQDEIQTTSDVNKEGGFLKIFANQNGDEAFILKSKMPVMICSSIMRDFSVKSQVLMQRLLDKTFYFIGIQKKGESFENFTCPDEIFQTLEDAIKAVPKYLKN